MSNPTTATSTGEGVIDESELCRRISGIQQSRWHRRVAPHKPLLILMMLGRLVNDKSRLVGFREIEHELLVLLQNFGWIVRKQTPDNPFKRLRNDHIWELHGPKELLEKSIEKLTLSEVRQLHGGFPREIFKLLKKSRYLVASITYHLLFKNWPSTIHDEIRHCVGLDSIIYTIDNTKLISDSSNNSLRRDPKFRDSVLHEYEEQCSVCGYDLKFGQGPFYLEAAHIQWHSQGGPATVNNGLALCGFHHVSFDRGIWTLRQDSPHEYVIQTSEYLRGAQKYLQQIKEFEGETLRLPVNVDHAPSERFVNWHRQWVFDIRNQNLAL